MNNSKILLLFILLVFGLNARAQTESSSIKGAVYSQDSEPAMYSTVVLMNRDSVFMSGTLSDDAGSFRFDNLKAGSYHIMIRNVEFNTYVSELINLSGNQSFDLGSVKLETRLNNLDEVVIKGEKAMVEVHSDKMVYNVSATVNSTGKVLWNYFQNRPG
jgi:hypothetical protein